MSKHKILGIDMGGTNLRGGIVHSDHLSGVISQKVNSKGSVEEVLHNLFDLTDSMINHSVKGIGIGVPGLIDNSGNVFDVVNIPSWKEVPLQKLMEERYQVPVLVNNDANCFALGEFYFGKGKGHHSIIGITIGTGLGSGIIINDHLYTGKNCGAGEFGMVDYLDKYFEYYASGQFFKNIYGINGEEVLNQAKQGSKEAIRMYEEMGAHLGNAIKMILYAFDPELIILGGSVSHSFAYFSKTMWESLGTFAFKRSVDRLKIEVSELENSGIFGAAGLHLDLKRNEK